MKRLWNLISDIAYGLWTPCFFSPPLVKPREWDMRPIDPKVVLEHELRGRLARRHRPDEPWQRGCIRLVIEHLRKLQCK